MSEESDATWRTCSKRYRLTDSSITNADLAAKLGLFQAEWVMHGLPECMLVDHEGWLAAIRISDEKVEVCRVKSSAGDAMVRLGFAELVT